MLRPDIYVITLTPHLHSDSPVVIDGCIAFLGNYFHRPLTKHWCSDLSQVHVSNDSYTLRGCFEGDINTGESIPHYI